MQYPTDQWFMTQGVGRAGGNTAEGHRRPASESTV